MKKFKTFLCSVVTLTIVSLSMFNSAYAFTLGERTLQLGSSGDDVQELQTKLSKFGFNVGEIDGVYGDITNQAITNFQQSKHLNADGITGNETLAALLNRTSVSRDSRPNNYSKEVDILATAYAPGAHDNGKWGNLTQLGTQIRPGIVAVDPKVIPLNSRLYIEYPDGHGEYAVAEDTGGAIKGNRIDIAKWTVSEAYDFGMQNVKVYILN